MSTSKTSDFNNDPVTAFSVLPAQFSIPGNKIKTKEFLNAAASAVLLIKRFGKVFSPVINDMNGNIKKLSDRYEKDVSLHEFLEDMILREQVEDEMVATESLMWLRRGLHFLSIFFQCIVDDTLSERCSMDLTPFLRRAYSESLEHYHGWLGTQLFNVLSRFAPNRRTLLCSLALEQENCDKTVIKNMHIYVKKMMMCVRRLEQFYEEHYLESFFTE